MRGGNAANIARAAKNASLGTVAMLMAMSGPIREACQESGQGVGTTGRRPRFYVTFPTYVRGSRARTGFCGPIRDAGRDGGRMPALRTTGRGVRSQTGKPTQKKPPRRGSEP